MENKCVKLMASLGLKMSNKTVTPCRLVIDRIVVVVVERSPRVWKVAGSISGQVIPNTLKMVVMVALLGAQDGGVKDYG